MDNVKNKGNARAFSDYIIRDCEFLLNKYSEEVLEKKKNKLIGRLMEGKV